MGSKGIETSVRVLRMIKGVELEDVLAARSSYEIAQAVAITAGELGRPVPTFDPECGPNRKAMSSLDYLEMIAGGEYKNMAVIYAASNRLTGGLLEQAMTEATDEQFGTAMQSAMDEHGCMFHRGTHERIMLHVKQLRTQLPTSAWITAIHTMLDEGEVSCKRKAALGDVNRPADRTVEFANMERNIDLKYGPAYPSQALHH
jgi:hypothetical protein